MPRHSSAVFPVLWALLCTAAAWAQSNPASLYEATVPLSANTERGRADAFAEAMRQVLVRVTGRAGAPDEPGLAPVVKEAGRYVQLYRQVQGGLLFVGFDGRRIEGLISTADPSQVREVTLEISGIGSVDAYAEVTGRLESLMQIGRLEVAELRSDTVVYRVRARGDMQQLTQAIGQIAHLQPDAGADGQQTAVLRYRYFP